MQDSLLQESDTGTYTITTFNAAGKGQATFQLKIKCMPCLEACVNPIIYYDLLAAPPKYSLETDYLEAEAGSSPTLAFTVSSDPPLAEDTEHTLSKSDGTKATKRFKVESNCITFRKVRVEDSGTYSISCCSEEGEVGQATLELEVTPPAPPTHQPAHSHGNTQTGKG